MKSTQLVISKHCHDVFVQGNLGRFVQADTSMVFLKPVCARWLLSSSDLTPFSTAAEEVTIESQNWVHCHRAGRLKSDCQLWLCLKEGPDHPMFCSTQSPLENVSVHPQKLGNLRPQMLPWRQGLHVEFFWLYVRLLHGFQRWSGGTVEEEHVLQFHGSEKSCISISGFQSQFWDEE